MSLKPRRRLYEILERDETGDDKVKSELDELIEEEEKELIREAKKLKLEEILLRRKARIKELQKKLGLTEMNSEISPYALKELAKLPEEEIQKIMRIYAMFKATEKTSVPGGLLPWLIGYARANPGSNEKAMVDFAKTVSSAFTEGLKLGTQITGRASKSSESLTEVLKIMKEMVYEPIKKTLDDLSKKMQPQPSPLEMILMDDRLYQRAKELGLFGGKQTPQVSDPKIMLEIEKLRSETQLKLKQMEHQLNIELAKLGLERTKMSQLTGFATRLGAAVARALEEGGEEVEEYSSSAIREKCQVCGEMLTVRPGQKKVICPSCGTEYKVE